MPPAHEPAGAGVPSLSLGTGLSPPRSGTGRQGRTGVGSPGGWGDTSRAGGEPPRRVCTASGSTHVSQSRKHRDLNLLKNNSARAQARNGNRGHRGRLGRDSLLETWLLLHQKIIFFLSFITTFLFCYTFKARPGARSCPGLWLRLAQLPPARLRMRRSVCQKGNTGSSGKEQGNDRISLRQILTKVQSIRLRNEPLCPVMASTAADITSYSLTGAGKWCFHVPVTTSMDMVRGADPVPASPTQAGLPCPDTAPDFAPQRQNWGTCGAGAELEA